MFFNNSKDDKRLYGWLKDALENAFKEESLSEGMWVQKYNEEGDDLWGISFSTYTTGRSILTPSELEWVKKRWEEQKNRHTFEEFSDVLEVVEELIYNRWKSYDTIYIEGKSIRYEDEYQTYGVKRSDFF